MRRPIRTIGHRLLAVFLIGILAAPVAAASPVSDAISRVASVMPPNPAAPAASEGFRKESGKLSKRGTVTVAGLPTAPAAAQSGRSLPRLRMPSNLGVDPGSPRGLAPAPAVPGPVPPLAGANGRPPIITTAPFDGWAFGTAFTNFEPPDPWVAVGPDHVVHVVNTGLRVFDRQGGLLHTVSLKQFFGVPLDDNTSNFDPRVIYDSLHGRWVATEVSFDCLPDPAVAVGHGYIDVAVSQTADPLGPWSTYFLEYADVVPDYPMVGTSTDKVAISTNMFGLSDGIGGCNPNGADYRGIAIDVLDWGQLAAGGDVVYVHLESAEHFTARPALQVPATSATIHGIAMTGSAEGDVHADYLRITGNVLPAATNTIAVATADLTLAGQVGAFGDPPPPNQPSDSPPTPDPILNAVDGRPTDALWQNGRLVWVSTIGCTPAGDSVVRDCVRATEIDTNSLARRQDFLIGLTGKDIFHGGIGLSMNGALHVTYTRSAFDEPPGTHAVYQVPGDATNAVSADELVRAGTSRYTLPNERWGDYTGVAQDPQDPNVVWQTNEVSTGAWATHFSPLSTAAGTTFVPITPTRVLDTRPATNVGLTNRFAHRVARTWQVTGVGLIPANAVAVTGNVTVVSQTGSGHVSVTPRPTNTPFSSTINFPLGDVRANNVTTPLGPGGTLAAVYIASPGKLTHLVFDVTGYFVTTTGFEYNPLTPSRILDTRPPLPVGLTASFKRNVPKSFQVWGAGGVPFTAVAVTGNLTVTRQTASGHVSLTPEPHANPPTSTLNFPLGDSRANGVTIPISQTTGKVSAVYKSSVAGSTTHLIFDVTGYYAAGSGGLRYFPLNPGRRMDTRASVMTGLTGSFQANAGRTLDTAGHLAIPSNAQAITGNLTVTQPTKAGHLALTPNPAANPPTSTLNFPVGDTRANGITQPLNASGDMSIWFKAAAGGRVHAILDITGYFVD